MTARGGNVTPIIDHAIRDDVSLVTYVEILLACFHSSAPRFSIYASIFFNIWSGKMALQAISLPGHLIYRYSNGSDQNDGLESP